MDFIVGGQWAALIAQTTATKDMDSANASELPHRVKSAELLADPPIKENFSSNDFTFGHVSATVSIFPLLRTRSGRYIFVPNEPCRFFKYAKSREARLPMPKSTFRIAFDNNFVPTELTLPGYPFPSIVSATCGQRAIFYSVSAAVISLSSFLCLLPLRTDW